MSPQAAFLNYILDNVQDGKQADAKEVLEGAFAQLAAGTFDSDALISVAGELMPLLKPDKVDEVQQTMKKFANQIGS